MAILDDVKNCQACPLGKLAKNKVLFRGGEHPKVLFVGEAPGEQEDFQGQPFVGPLGELLNRWAQTLNLKADEWAAVNVIKCRPTDDAGNNREPNIKEIASCSSFLLRQIDELKPAVIVPLGLVATRFFLSEVDTISSAKAQLSEAFGYKIFPLYHPAYCLRNQNYNWLYDLEKLRQVIELEAEKSEKVTEGVVKQVQNYVPLHLHTEFSCLDSIIGIDRLVKTASEMGFKALAITDHGTMRGTFRFYNLCRQFGIKPIIGVEIYVTGIRTFEKSKKEAADTSLLNYIPETADPWNTAIDNTHLTLLAVNYKGYQNLCKLQTEAHANGFYYRPRTTYKLLEKYSEGIICMTGCTSGYVSRMINQKKVETAKKFLVWMKSVFGDRLFVELMPNDLKEQQNHNIFAAELARELGITLVATTDTHYILEEEHKVHKVLKAIGYGKKITDPNVGYSTTGFYLMNTQQLEGAFVKNHPSMHPSVIKEIIDNTNKVADLIQFQFPEAHAMLPKPKGTKSLVELVEEGWIKRGFDKLSPEQTKVYRDRLDLELGRFTEKGFDNYLLLIADLISWAKRNKIQCGPSRGSVAASLVCYCLGITELDPIQRNLLFDRFVSPIRSDYPDIDMDFEDLRREEVISYLTRTYGAGCVAHIGVEATFKGKMALRDVAKAYGVPEIETRAVTPLIVQRSGGDARTSFTLADSFNEFEQCKAYKLKYPEVVEMAQQFEGRVRHITTHAAGVAVSPIPLSDMFCLESLGGQQVTGLEHNDLEKLGLVKLDVLGLNTLSILRKAADEVKRRKGVAIDFYSLPLDDKLVYDKVFKEGKCSMVFQFETKGLSKLARSLKIDSFKLLTDATALHRPGTLHSGLTAEYVSRHRGLTPVVYPHPALEPFLKDTLGITLYQEQVMIILHDLGRLSWQHSDIARKIMAKSQGKKEFDKFRTMFSEGAVKNGLSETEASDIYNQISMFGSYGFNLAHAAVYAQLSYWCGFMKTYYPVEFAYAMISLTDKERKAEYIREAQRLGIKIVSPNIETSDCEAKLQGDVIVQPLTDITNVGSMPASKIIKNRPFASLSQLIKEVKPSFRILQNLALSGALDCLKVSRKYVFENAEELAKGHTPQVDQTIDWSGPEKLMKQREVVDTAGDISDMEVFNELYEKFYAKFGKPNISDLGDLDLLEQSYDEVWVKGIVSFVNFKSEGLEGAWTLFDAGLERRYAHINMDDGSDFVLVHLSPEQYTYYKKYLERPVGFPILVKGHTSKGFSKIYCDAMIVLDDVDENNPAVKLIADGRKADLVKIRETTDKELQVGLIKWARYRVSKKNKNPYAEITFSDGTRGLCFSLTQKILVAGEILVYSKDNPELPFIEIIDRK